MELLLAQKSYNQFAQAGVDRGLQSQSVVSSTRSQTPGAVGLHQKWSSALCQQATAWGSHEVTPATPYQQAVHPHWQVRFASPVTKAEPTTSQNQSVAKRRRPQSREQGGRQELASCSRARRDRSSTWGPKKRRRISSEDPMDELMDFIPSGWKRDLIHMVGCFYASQITPLNSQRWHSDRDKFIQAMEEHKNSEWLDIKELMPLQYMLYVARCFQETTGHHLRGLDKHTKWIRARSYYHWKVAQLGQLQNCPHLWGLLASQGPMEHPSEIPQPQRPNRPRAVAPGASGSSRVGGLITLKSFGESFWMEGRAGDGSSWFEWVTHEEAGTGACKRKKLPLNSKHLAAPSPLYLRKPGRRWLVLSMSIQWAGSHLRKTSPQKQWHILSGFHSCCCKGSGEPGTLHDRWVPLGLCHHGLHDHQPYCTWGSWAISASIGGLHPSRLHRPHWCVSPRPQVQQPTCRSVAAPSGHDTQLRKGGLGVSGAVETH